MSALPTAVANDNLLRSPSIKRAAWPASEALTALLSLALASSSSARRALTRATVTAVQTAPPAGVGKPSAASIAASARGDRELSGSNALSLPERYARLAQSGALFRLCQLPELGEELKFVAIGQTTFAFTWAKASRARMFSGDDNADAIIPYQKWPTFS